jgi:glycosyltransferase involved in cell wall biosynthesis
MRESDSGARDGLQLPPDSAEMRPMWITWNTHRRTTGLTTAWQIPLYVIASSRRPPLSWAIKSIETLRLLRRHRPGLLFVQNPSLALTILAVVARPFCGYRLVVDAHNEGVRPFDRRGCLVRRITLGLMGTADVTIVTNRALAGDVRSAGGVPIVLSDRLPEPPPMTESDPGKTPVILAVIATFRRDEPVDEILTAARMLPECRFVFSGDPGQFLQRKPDLPANVEFAGYMQDTDYWSFLARATVVCDLTLKPDCLVCGAYEGLALAKPLLLSDNPATRETFGDAAILTDSDPDSIAEAVGAAVRDCPALAANARTLRERYREQWRSQSTEAWEAICTAAGFSVSRV